MTVCETCKGTKVYEGKTLDCEKHAPGHVEGVIRTCPTCGQDETEAETLSLYILACRDQGFTVRKQEPEQGDRYTVRADPDAWKIPKKKALGFG